MDPKLQKVIKLVEQSRLDQTIKDILIRDLNTEGLEGNDFLKEQIKAYCLAEIDKIDQEIVEVKKLLETAWRKNSSLPAMPSALSPPPPFSPAGPTRPAFLAISLIKST